MGEGTVTQCLEPFSVGVIGSWPAGPRIPCQPQGWFYFLPYSVCVTPGRLEQTVNAGFGNFKGFDAYL